MGSVGAARPLRRTCGRGTVCAAVGRATWVPRGKTCVKPRTGYQQARPLPHPARSWETAFMAERPACKREQPLRGLRAARPARPGRARRFDAG